MPDHALVLFDIDGTLLDSGGAGGRAFAAAARDVFDGRVHFDGVEFAGRLDRMILTEAAERVGLPLADGHHDAFESAYVGHLAAELERTPGRMRVMPGVEAALDVVASRDGVAVGLLTGNLASGAALKLRAAGIDPARFVTGAYGDDAATRAGLVPVALRRLREQTGDTVPAARVVVIGDTPRDVACARANDSIAFAVCTGGYDRAKLTGAGADVVVDDLTDPAPLTAVLDRVAGAAREAVTDHA